MPATQADGRSPVADDAWSEPRPTALLVLADGTVLEGFGVGAVGEADGEVCFNTAMTGYQEILTDPSYAGQIVTFTFPHIGNVGVNDDDVETVNLAAILGRARHRRARADHRARQLSGDPPSRRLARRRAASSGSAGVDTRALTALIRRKGMPNAVLAHDPDGRLRHRGPEARGRAGCPRWTGSTSCRRSRRRSASTGTRSSWGWDERVSAARREPRGMSWRSTTA